MAKITPQHPKPDHVPAQKITAVRPHNKTSQSAFAMIFPI
jgi:DNA-binding transcriptional regulator YiaG